MHSFDAVIIGAGAAGLFCAGVAGQLGLKVLVIDHAAKVAEKVRIAGGGRCNFTNRDLDPRAPHRHFLGENPQFCRSALSRYTAQDFIDLVQRHQIPFHEKHKGQLFGDRSSEDFIRMLLAECEAGGVQRGQAWAPYAQWAGLSLPVRIETGAKKPRMAFDEDLLFTHRGLSGPAVLQISSYWQPGTPLQLDLAPGAHLQEALLQAKTTSRKRIANELAAHVPARLADAWTQQEAAWQRPVNEASDKALADLAARLSAWALQPTGTEGYKKAEVTAGGVDTRALSQQTLESTQPGLYFIGEVVDITGWLGGYNFQWAWSSGWACAQGLAQRAGRLPPAAG